MARCEECKKDMTGGESCSMEHVTIDGASFARIPKGAETFDLKASGSRCGDCGVTNRGFHHPGCAKELCPKCAEQLFCCDCAKSDED